MTLLLTSHEIETGAPQWARQAHAQYRSEILDPAFPCYFGTKAEAQGHMRFCLVPVGEPGVLPPALAEFVRFSREHASRRHVFIAIFEEPSAGFDADEARFWRLLEHLHRADPAEWPPDVPEDPEDPHWEFCFAGDPMFAFPCIPTYEHRRSRRMGGAFLMCFQPRRIFFGVERSDPGGERIRADIYDRVRLWDHQPPHPELEQLAYGDPNMREWKQYVLPDQNTDLPARCPMDLSAQPTGDTVEDGGKEKETRR